MKHTRFRILSIILTGAAGAAGFSLRVPSRENNLSLRGAARRARARFGHTRHKTVFRVPSRENRQSHRRSGETALRSEVVATAEAEADKIHTDSKEAVKLFGRLAEKYIMLDASAGMCCYSGCSDCEYREPGGGYRMADQSSARPKWIPCYDRRVFEAQGKDHTAKWNSDIFPDTPAVTKGEFVARVTAMAFAPPLGGPYMPASQADITDQSAAAALFDILAGEKEKLTRHRMGKEMKTLANGEEGLTWKMFAAAMGAN